jgi:carbon-monoxide dehydrogenase medium subunit
VGDFATVGLAVALETSGGTINRAGLALTGVGPSNIQCTAAEQALAGKTLNASTIEQAARLAAEAAQPKTDVRGSAEYKRHIVYTFVMRALGNQQARAA